MGLKLYKQKREFDKTPEPSGKEVKHTGQLNFVIQKHDATRLHYDFRLEAGGVLKSWAVPKGPSLNPVDKRLAMMVEDHPYDYRNFEGVIPEGNYGAGNVIIWDEGTYEAVNNTKNSNKEILSEIEKGDVKFRLFGKKLHGIFALVKLKHAREENAWLLIKDRDQYASEKDITENDKSVESGLKVEEIDQQKTKPNIKELLRQAKKQSLPEFVKPMLATLVDEPFNSDDFLFEIKWDGYRAIADVDKKNVRLYSRNEISFNKDYPDIVNALSDLNINAVFDGEIVIVDKNGKANFQDLQNFRKTGEGNLVYYVFDILNLEGHNLVNLPLLKRREVLSRVLAPQRNIRISDFVEMDGKKLFTAAKREGVEGIIAKNKNSNYLPGVRGNDWLKIKSHKRQEAIICGFTRARGGRKYFGALILGIYKNKKLTYIGHTGGGFDEESLKTISEKLEKIKIESSPFEHEPETNEPATWVKPQLLCEVSFAGWTEGENMRQPIFEGLREDKNPKEIGVEEEKSEKLILEGKSGEQISNVSVSNLDKVFWPDEGFTKGDLLKYYEEVSEFILPHLKDRPESLRRYPNGISDEGFFQKDITFKLPNFAKTFKYHSDSEEKTVNYLVCNNRETLIYMVNLGCIDINPWNSTTDNPSHPDYIIFDLDPEDIGFDKVIEAAIEVRKVLEEIEVESFVKTSGATGIHIYVPTGAKYTYDQIKTFAQILVNVVNKKNSDFTSVLRLPEKRQKKVYLDFLQNRIGQTLAAPYSVRAKPGATVSMPLKWTEVKRGLKPKDFTIKNSLNRIEKMGDIWKPVLGKGIDLKKTLQKLEKLLS